RGGGGGGGAFVGGGGVVAAEGVVVEVDAEGLAAAVAAMDGARAAPLRPAAAQAQAELVEDAGDRQLLFEMGEVDITAGAGRSGRRACDRISRGDLLLCRHVRCEARGWFVEWPAHVTRVWFGGRGVRPCGGAGRLRRHERRSPRHVPAWSTDSARDRRACRSSTRRRRGARACAGRGRRRWPS